MWRESRPSVAVSAWLTPALMVYYLCCWPGEDSSDTSSEKHKHKSVNKHEGTRRISEVFSRRIGSSAVSLHLPSTSGHSKDLSSHRSHEEIRRRKSHHESQESTRYHSAPSVIDEVLHRRDWERSNRDLHIPLKDSRSISSDSLEQDPPHAEPESSSIEAEEIKPCKKHHTNIKSSKAKKEKDAVDDKDRDATEETGFYIGDNEAPASNDMAKVFFKAKEAKQNFNESIRSRTLVPLEEHQPRTFGFCLNDVIEQLETLDRSGATHHTIESRVSLSKPPYPPPSVETVGYEGGACYLAESGSLRPAGAVGATGAAGAGGSWRARHASDGDILAPPHRPESGAFSESDLDFEADSEELPPSYEDLHHFATPEKKETAI